MADIRQVRIDYLGVDFGSSNTSIIAVTEDGELIVFPSIKDTANIQFPTVVSVKGYGESRQVFAAHSAYTNYSDGMVLNNNVKENIFKLGHECYAREYFRHVFEHIKKLQFLGKNRTTVSCCGFENATVCYGYPYYYSPRERDNFCKIVEDILVKTLGCKAENVFGQPEPELAAQAYGYANQKRFLRMEDEGDTTALADGSRIMVLDFGGFTLDVALMRVRHEGDESIVLETESHSESFRGDVRLGKSITEALGRLLHETEEEFFDPEIDKSKCKLFDEGEGYREARCDGKSKRGNRPYVLTYDALDTDVAPATNISLCGIDFEVDVLQRLANCVHDYLRSALDKRGKIGALIYTGGVSRMTPLREAIRDSISDYLDEDVQEVMMDDKKHATEECERLRLAIRDVPEYVPLSSASAVAYGAALVASGKRRVKRSDGSEQDRYNTLADKKLRQELDNADERIHELEQQLKASQRDNDSLALKLRREKLTYKNEYDRLMSEITSLKKRLGEG